MEEVEILNVGGDGVASEVTMQRLAVTMEAIARAKGVDPKKIQQEFNKLAASTKENRKRLEESESALREHTEAVEDSESAFRSLGRGLLGAFSVGISSAVDSVKGLTNELIGSSKHLSSFASHIPLVGNSLSALASISDDSYENFSDLAKTGATFDYSLSELRISARELNMEMSELAGFVRSNSEMLAAFGGTVDGGIRATRALEASLTDDVINRFQVLGIQTEEITEALAYQQYIDRAGRATRTRDEQAQALAAQSLTENMLMLAKLTGEDVQTQRDRLRQNQMDIAFQMQRMRLDETQRGQLDILMNQAASVGPEAVNALKAEFLGFPAVTREVALFQTLQRGVFNELTNELGIILDGSQTLEQFQARTGERMADLIEQQIRAASENETLLAAGSAGLSGIAQEFAQQFGTSADRILQFMEFEDGEFRFARDQFLENFDAAEFMPDPDDVDDELSGLAAFRNTLDEARESITESLINPFADNILGPALDRFSSWMQGFTADETGEGSKFDKLLGHVNTVLDTIGPRLERFMDALSNDPAQAFEDLFEDITDAIADFLLGPNTRDIMGGPGGRYKIGEEEIARTGGFLQSMGDSIGNALREGGFVDRLTDNLTDIFTEVFSNLEDIITGGGNQTTSSIASGEDFSTGLFDPFVSTLDADAFYNQASRGSFDPRNLLDSFNTSMYLKRAYGELQESGVGSADAKEQILDALNEYVSQNYEGERLQTMQEYLQTTIADTLNELPSYNDGTNGFENFGRGRLAILHGSEAVIPRNSAVGEALANPVDISDNASYNNSMSELVTKLDRFIEINRNNTSEARSQQMMQQLNQTMTGVLEILERQYDVEKRTERGLRGLGGNVLRSSPSGR